MKKVGRWLLVLVPIIIGFVVSFGVGFAAMMMVSVVVGVQLGMSGEMLTMTELEFGEYVLNIYFENAMLITLISQIIGFVIFIIWFRLQGNKKFVNPARALRPTNFGVIALLALGMQLLTNIALSIVFSFAPDVMESYVELMETAGLDETTVVSVISVVIMAPIVEELIFRGITMKLATKAGASFIVANIVQAILFGVYHCNLVQGVYAAVLGLVLGYVVYRYHSLWASIFLHLVFNLSSIILSELSVFLPESIGTYIGYVVVGVIAIVGAMLIMRKEPAAQVEKQEAEPAAVEAAVM